MTVPRRLSIESWVKIRCVIVMTPENRRLIAQLAIAYCQGEITHQEFFDKLPQYNLTEEYKDEVTGLVDAIEHDPMGNDRSYKEGIIQDAKLILEELEK